MTKIRQQAGLELVTPSLQALLPTAPSGRLTPIARHFHPFQPVSVHSRLRTAVGDPSQIPLT